MAIKGILFDAAGVLYCRTGPTEHYALTLLKDAGLTADVSSQARERQLALHSQASRGQVSHAVYWDQFLQMRGVTGQEQRQAMVRQIVDYSNNVLPTPGNRKALAGLKQRGFVLGIVTDTMYPLEWKMRRLEKAGVAEFIDVVACSTVLGVKKPESAIYLDAVRQANLRVDESAFVGHDAGELEGARQAGLKTVAVLYDPHARADYYAGTLTELLDVPIFQCANP